MKQPLTFYHELAAERWSNFSCRTLLVFVCFFCVLSVRAQIFEFSPFVQQRETPPQELVEPAKFKDGNKGLDNFLEKNFRFVPEGSKVEGRILVACVINEKGKISESVVRRGLGKELDAEALRVVGKLKFKPARVGKKKVKSRIDIVLPIRRGKVSFSTLKTTDV